MRTVVPIPSFMWLCMHLHVVFIGLVVFYLPTSRAQNKHSKQALCSVHCMAVLEVTWLLNLAPVQFTRLTS